MTPIEAAILGLVEGLTEFLPVSSTGHLVLTSHLLGLPQTDFLKSFEIAIQVGAMFAVLMLYWKEFLRVETLKRVAAAFVPTALIGLALYKVAKEYLLGSTTVVVAALAVGGFALIAFESWYSTRPRARTAGSAPVTAGSAAGAKGIEQMTYAQAAAIGTVQSLAIVPGVSRSAATIVGGLALGLDRETVVRFSFLLAVPTIGAATALDLFKNASAFASADITALAVGALVSFFVALAAIRFFLQFVRTNTFIPFGIYRIAVAALFCLLVR